MSINTLQQATFYKSAGGIKDFPEDRIREIAMVGRSNSGKSTVLNSIIGQQKARVSKTPGRTGLVNFFILTPGNYLVDLPGFGFAKVSKSVKKYWQMLMDDYFHHSPTLQGIILLMDIRHPLKESDQKMLRFAKAYGFKVHVLLNKADKLSKNQQLSTMATAKKKLAVIVPNASIQLYSSPKHIGKEELVALLLEWLQLS